MTTKIELNPIVWTNLGDIYVRGHAYYKEKYIDAEKIGSIVERTGNIEELSNFLSDLNGFYSIVINKGSENILAADRMRTGPVFYTIVNGDLLVSDDCGWIIENSDNLFRSEISEIEYETARIVTASNTLYEEISQLQSGEIVVFNEIEESISTYQHHVHTTTESTYTVAQLEEEFQRVLDAAFKRLVNVADGRPIAVPLSGGYDSRLIALMLKRVGYENVITYTVNTGGKNTPIAKQVANNLDFPWITADLTHSEWRDFYESEEWGTYFDQAACLGGLPHPTAVLPLQKLKKSGKIPEDAIFVPGHSALDTMKATPVEFEDQDKIQLDQLTDSIVGQHFKYNEHVSIPEDDLQERVIETVGFNTSSAPNSAVEAFERWRLRERRTKLIVNGVRTFDLFGYEWWIPLEDQEIYEFWRKVPMKHKRHRSFYESYIENMYISMCEITEIEASANADSDLKSTISHLIRGLPIESPIRRSYNIWDESRLKYEYMKRKCLDEMYESDPRFGIMSKEKLKQNYEGQSFPFFSLLARSTTGKIDLQ